MNKIGRINAGSILPSGWHFYASDRSYRIPIMGELPNPEAVVDAILDYRLQNSIPAGDPLKDFEEYVCTNFPKWCNSAYQYDPPVPNHPTMRHVDLVASWSNELYTKGGTTLIPQREAEERANACSNCPMQVNWSQDCPPCVTMAQRILTMLRQGKDTVPGQEGKLQMCSLYGWDNRTACHIERKHLTPVTNPLSPNFCWMRQVVQTY